MRRAERAKTGRFLAEGANAVGEAIAAGAEVYEVFVTEQAAQGHAGMLERAEALGVRVSTVTDRAASALSGTVTPQGILAVCGLVDVAAAEALAGAPQLVAVLAGIADPGNAGTVLRAADAAGADAVLFAGDTVDPHNDKAVRAGAGSLFHLPVARVATLDAALHACRAAGLRVLGTSGTAERTVHPSDERFRGPVAWVFGSEAHGLPADARLDELVGLPIYGRAESLNLAAAAAVCLYTSAFAKRHTDQPGVSPR